ncbi:MAG TPA: GerMN domain-containing protein [Acidimicrobiia bacterium]
MSRRRRSVALLAGLAMAAVAACGVDTDEEPRAIDADNVPDTVTEDTAAQTVERAETSEVIDVWFVRSTEDSVRLVPHERSVPRSTPRSVLEALLLQPPTEEERADGLTTALPGSTALVSSPELRGDGVLVVDLSKGIFEIQGETLRDAFGQIVCTVTGLETVRSVVFRVDGDPAPVPDGESRQTDEPLRCESYANLLDGADG